VSFEWEEVDGVMAKVKRNLRPLLRFLSLQGTQANTVLLETLAVMTEAFDLGEPLPVLTVSTALIPMRSKRYLLDSAGVIVRDRYEFLVYRLLREGLEAGDLHCHDSTRFRSFDDDLVDEEPFGRRADLLPNEPFFDMVERVDIALVERLGIGVAALGVIQHRQIVQRVAHVQVVRPQGLFPDRQGVLVQRLGLGVAGTSI